jgi:hypothetical protein
LVSEDGEFQLVAPTAFESFVLHQVRFESHPEPGGQSGRGTVAGVDPGVDPVESEFVEGQMQQSMDRVGGIAVAGEPDGRRSRSRPAGVRRLGQANMTSPTN